MKYTVKERRALGGDKAFEVYSPDVESIEDWMYEAYILGIKPNEEGDIVLPLIDAVSKGRDSFIVERWAFVNSSTKSFTGISTIVFLFKDKEDAESYKLELNGKLK